MMSDELIATQFVGNIYKRTEGEGEGRIIFWANDGLIQANDGKMSQTIVKC